MIPASFDYTAPESLADAIAALGGDAEEIKVLAGGQSLIPVLKLRLAAPTLIVDIGKIDDLRGISDAGDAVVIGTLTTHDEVANSSVSISSSVIVAGVMAELYPSPPIPVGAQSAAAAWSTSSGMSKLA